MNVLIAPNSMKGSLSTFEFADVVAKAFHDISSEFNILKIPVADGGDFTGEVLQKAFNAEFIPVEVVGPLENNVQSGFWQKGKTAIIEMAGASGMKLVDPESLNPLKASSFGTGQLIIAAIQKGCSEILLAIGGSATVDGGMGMMEALGFRFLDENGRTLKGNGKNLLLIISFEKSELPENIVFKIICDVDNPLLGENGAAAVFGPQKGATPEMVIELEKGLKNWSEIIRKETGKDLVAIRGIGAAGGIALPLMAFHNAELVEGASFVLSSLEFEKHVQWADLVITGEGKIDNQTLNNKAPFAVAQTAKKYGKPIYAFAGIAENFTSEIFDNVYTLVNEKVSKKMAISNAKELLYQSAVEFAVRLKQTF